MKLFELSWKDYDCLSYWLFLHENKTQEEFDKDVRFLLKKYGDEYIDGELGWVSASSWMEYISDKFEELGYKNVEPITWSFFGASLINHDGEMSSEDIKWGEIVGNDLIKRAKEFNENVKDELDGNIPKIRKRKLKKLMKT